MGLFKSRVLQIGILVGLPVGLCLAALVVKRATPFRLSVATPQYVTNFAGKRGLDGIYFNSRLDYQFKRPLWWVQSKDGSLLKFVSATVVDSSGARVNADELQLPPGQGTMILDWGLSHIGVLKPQRMSDLSRGGWLTVRLRLPSQDGRGSSWEGEATVELPPTK